MKVKCDIIKLLEHAGVSKTPHRVIVLKSIVSSQKAIDARQILEQVQRRQKIDKVTVYRILDLFVAKKLVRRIAGLDGAMSYEVLCKEHHPVHPHFVCRSCGTMECLEESLVDGIRKKLKQNENIDDFQIDLKIEGLCSTCH